MLLHPTAFALMSYLYKSKRWEKVDWIDANPRLPNGASNYIPELVEAGLVLHSTELHAVHITIPGMVIVKVLSEGSNPFAQLMAASRLGTADAAATRHVKA
jgi:hypothetical protein